MLSETFEKIIKLYQQDIFRCKSIAVYNMFALENIPIDECVIRVLKKLLSHAKEQDELIKEMLGLFQDIIDQHSHPDYSCNEKEIIIQCKNIIQKAKK